MHHDQLSSPIDRFAAGIIRRKARQLVEQARLGHHDREDFEQELTRRLLERLPAYDPARGDWKAFITTVVERATASMHRDRRAAKRGPGTLISLSEVIDSCEGGVILLADALTPRDRAARRGLDTWPEQELVQLRADVTEVVAELPPKLRQLAQQLKSKSLAAVARELGIPRTTLREWVREIRIRFEQRGLRNYL